MIIRGAWIRTVLFLAVALPAPGFVHAQLGGLVKQKATEALKGPEKKDEQGAGTLSVLPGGVQEMTAPVLQALQSALRVEVELRREFRAELAKYPTREEYNQCQAKVAMSEENQNLLKIMELPETATAAEMQAAMTKFAEAGAALLKKRCPLDPNEWNDSKKQARLLEIEAKAAQSFRVRGAGSGEHQETLGGPLDEDEEPGFQQSGQAEAYRMLKERIVPFCDAVKNVNLQEARLKGLRLPTSNPKIFWVYTAEEVKALEPLCKDLLALLAQL